MEAHLGSGNRICTVVFADIVQYGEESVSRQVEMKAAFSLILAAALEHSPASDRVILDTGDGAALCFLGDPEDALFAANSLRSAVIEAPEEYSLRLRLGINLGPVRIVNDINGRSNVIGDGINVAQRVMSFAEPNQILVSRSYYEVVSRLAPDYAQLFQYVGLHRDKHVREHEVYEVHLGKSLGRPAAETAESGAPAATSPIAAPAPAGRTVRLDPACIERLTSALAREIGPVAKLIVQRAAERAADEGALMDAVAEHVPAANRAGFLARRSDLLGPPRASVGAPRVQATGAAGQPPSQASQQTQSIRPEVLVRAEQMLTVLIGPVARILVRRAAMKAASPRDLFGSLAVHIDNPEVRKVFLAEAERL
jgi:class 3 adenylate cyclase